MAVARAQAETSRKTLNTSTPKNVRVIQRQDRQPQEAHGYIRHADLANLPRTAWVTSSRIVVLEGPWKRGVEVEYKLVSSEEADVEKGLISTTSPIGRALLNRKVGQV